MPELTFVRKLPYVGDCYYEVSPGVVSKLVTLYSANVAIKEAYEQGKLDAAPEWINVKEALPKSGESTFIYARPNAHGGLSVGIGYRAVNGTYRTESGLTETGMSYWMPLPAAPKQEK